MNNEDIAAVLESLTSYRRGMITRNELFAVASKTAASVSVQELLSVYPADLHAEISIYCIDPPGHLDDWIAVESVCLKPEADEMAYVQHRKLQSHKTYQGYCRLHEHFHKTSTS